MAPRRILEFDPWRFGQAVQRIRKARRLRQPEADEQAGLKIGTVYRIENARNLSGRGITQLAIWADLDLRDFTKEPPQ